MTSLPMTPVELDQLARDYQRNTSKGCLPPLKKPDKEIGKFLRASLKASPSDPDEKIFHFLSASIEDDAQLAQTFHRFAAWSQLEEQIGEHQLQHQISGLIEKTFNFAPLDFTCQELRRGRLLTVMGDDFKRLSANAREIAAAFFRAAEGPGAEWIRYREIDFKLEDGTSARRYQRDSWADLQAKTSAATSALICNGGNLYGIQEGKALSLTLWENEEDGDSETWVLVHPALASTLDVPNTYWC